MTSTERKLTRGLAGASLGLGLSEMLAPEKVAEMTGVDDSKLSRPLIRVMGLRECGHGAALLLGPSDMVWTRVAGDALDLTLLGRAIATRKGFRRVRSAVATMAVAGITAADVYAAMLTSRNGRHANGTTRDELHAAVTVWRSPEDVYNFWRKLENLPTFMYHLKSVTEEPSGRSRWVANAPLGGEVAWEAEIVEDEPGRRISWRSLPGASVDNRGTVEFRRTPDEKGTEVRVRMSYQMPGGTLGKAAARLFGESPEQQVHDDLRRFKQVMETGEVVVSSASPEGTASFRQIRQRAGFPLPRKRAGFPLPRKRAGSPLPRKRAGSLLPRKEGAVS